MQYLCFDLPQVLQLVKHVLGAVVDVNLHHVRVKVLHCELLGEGAHKERLHGVDACYLVRQQGPLRLVPVLQEHKTCAPTPPREKEKGCDMRTKMWMCLHTRVALNHIGTQFGRSTDRKRDVSGLDCGTWWKIEKKRTL